MKQFVLCRRELSFTLTRLQLAFFMYKFKRFVIIFDIDIICKNVNIVHEIYNRYFVS